MFQPVLPDAPSVTSPLTPQYHHHHLDNYDDDDDYFATTLLFHCSGLLMNVSHLKYGEKNNVVITTDKSTVVRNSRFMFATV